MPGIQYWVFNIHINNKRKLMLHAPATAQLFWAPFPNIGRIQEWKGLILPAFLDGSFNQHWKKEVLNFFPFPNSFWTLKYSIFLVHLIHLWPYLDNNDDPWNISIIESNSNLTIMLKLVGQCIGTRSISHYQTTILGVIAIILYSFLCYSSITVVKNNS